VGAGREESMGAHNGIWTRPINSWRPILVESKRFYDLG